MLKKNSLSFILFIFVLLCFPIHAFADEEIKVLLDGKEVEFSGEKPSYDPKTKQFNIPMYFMPKGKDTEIQWDPEQKTLFINTIKKEHYLLKEATGKGVKVAVIDSGISPHPDLTIVDGVNFVDETKSYHDDNNHGTMVAGIIASKEIGIAPDVELYALKVLDHEARGYAHDIVTAVEWAIENDMDILNISIVLDDEYKPLNKVIQQAIEKGIIVIASAGNTGEEVTSPASIDGVISVGALNSDMRTRASFSSHIGRVDFYTKGTNIYSTNRHGSYEGGWWGTSFSAPYVTGIFSLYKEAFPYATAEELIEIVRANAKEIVPNSNMWIPEKPKYRYDTVDIPHFINGEKTTMKKRVLIPLRNVETVPSA